MNHAINPFIEVRFWAATILLTSVLLSTFSHGNSPDTRFSKQQIREDFAQLYTDLQTAHFDLFANTPKTAYDEFYQQWQNKIDGPLTLTQAKVLFQQFIALGDVAHARIDLPMQDFSSFLQQGGRMFPIFLQLREDRGFIDTVYIDDVAVELWN